MKLRIKETLCKLVDKISFNMLWLGKPISDLHLLHVLAGQLTTNEPLDTKHMIL